MVKNTIAPTARLSLSAKDSLFGYLFIAPQMVGFVLFHLGPLLAVFITSLRDTNLLTGESIFVGLANYQTMFFEDPLFWKTLRNSFVFASGLVPLNVVLGLLLALLLNQAVRGISIFRAIFFSPVVTSAVAWALVWVFLLQDQGPINQYLGLIGINGPNWLREPNSAMFSVIVTRSLKGVGINMVLFLTALQNIPEEYLDAAKVDGATRLSAFRHITLPLLTPTIFLVTVLTLIGSFKVFDTIFMMTNGGPSNATMVLVYYVYFQAFEVFEIGYASGVAVVLFVVVLMLTIIQWSLRGRFVYNE